MKYSEAKKITEVKNWQKELKSHYSSKPKLKGNL